jgi:hypothetical protein
MPILGIIASGISGNLSNITSAFATDGTAPLTNTFGSNAQYFTQGYIYWGAGRGLSVPGNADKHFTIYQRTTSSSTWSVLNSSTRQGQFSANAYPVNGKWIKACGEYGGPLNDVESLTYGGSWTSETSYPISCQFNGGTAMNNVGYFVCGNNGTSDISAVYSYTGTGTWTTQTNYPETLSFTVYNVAANATKVFVFGGTKVGNTTQSSLVYSYTGSGSWVAETSMPVAGGTRQEAINVVWDSSKGRFWRIPTAGGVTSLMYTYTGTGAWTNQGNISAALSAKRTSYTKNLVYASNKIWAIGGDYNALHGSTLVMGVQ